MALLEQAESERAALLVASPTMAEVVYVLESVYCWDRRNIAQRLLQLIDASVVTMPDRNVLIQALIWYRDIAGLHFADSYVAALSQACGHGMVVSFDQRLRRVPGITVVQDPSNFA